MSNPVELPTSSDFVFDKCGDMCSALRCSRVALLTHRDLPPAVSILRAPWCVLPYVVRCSSFEVSMAATLRIVAATASMLIPRRGPGTTDGPHGGAKTRALR